MATITTIAPTIDSATLPSTPAAEWADSMNDILSAHVTKTPGKSYLSSEFLREQSDKTLVGSAKTYLPAEDDFQRFIANATQAAKAHLPQSNAAYVPDDALTSTTAAELERPPLLQTVSTKAVPTLARGETDTSTTAHTGHALSAARHDGTQFNMLPHTGHTVASPSVMSYTSDGATIPPHEGTQLSMVPHTGHTVYSPSSIASPPASIFSEPTDAGSTAVHTGHTVGSPSVASTHEFSTAMHTGHTIYSPSSAVSAPPASEFSEPTHAGSTAIHTGHTVGSPSAISHTSDGYPAPSQVGSTVVYTTHTVHLPSSVASTDDFSTAAHASHTVGSPCLLSYTSEGGASHDFSTAVHTGHTIGSPSESGHDGASSQASYTLSGRTTPTHAHSADTHLSATGTRFTETLGTRPAADGAIDESAGESYPGEARLASTLESYPSTSQTHLASTSVSYPASTSESYPASTSESYPAFTLESHPAFASESHPGAHPGDAGTGVALVTAPDTHANLPDGVRVVRGTMPASRVPLARDGGVDRTALERNADGRVDEGVGEGYFHGRGLGGSEKKRLIARFKEKMAGGRHR